MSLLVKDANQAVQPISTQADVAGNLVPVHTPAALVGGIAQPVGPASPLPVINAAGGPAMDGSGAITVGGTAQPLFGGTVPTNGFLIANNSSHIMYWSDVGPAVTGGDSVPIIAGDVFVTPSGYKPAGPVSLLGTTTADAFAARRW